MGVGGERAGVRGARGVRQGGEEGGGAEDCGEVGFAGDWELVGVVGGRKRGGTDDLSWRNWGSHWSPGSVSSCWGCGSWYSAPEGVPAAIRPAVMASGSGGGGGAGPPAGVLMRLTS